MTLIGRKLLPEFIHESYLSSEAEMPCAVFKVDASVQPYFMSEMRREDNIHHDRYSWKMCKDKEPLPMRMEGCVVEGERKQRPPCTVRGSWIE